MENRGYSVRLVAIFILAFVFGMQFQIERGKKIIKHDWSNTVFTDYEGIKIYMQGSCAPNKYKVLDFSHKKDKLKFKVDEYTIIGYHEKHEGYIGQMFVAYTCIKS